MNDGNNLLLLDDSEFVLETENNEPVKQVRLSGGTCTGECSRDCPYGNSSCNFCTSQWSIFG